MYSDYSNLLKPGKKSKLGTISSQIYRAERDRGLWDKYSDFGNACMVVTSKLCAAFDAHNENKKCELDAASLVSATKEKDDHADLLNDACDWRRYVEEAFVQPTWTPKFP